MIGQSISDCRVLEVTHNNLHLVISEEDSTQKMKLMLARARYEDVQFRKLVVGVYDSIQRITSNEAIDEMFASQGPDLTRGSIVNV